MKMQTTQTKFSVRPSAPALAGMATMGHAGSLRGQIGPYAIPRLQIVPKPEKNLSLKAGDLFGYHMATRRRTEFWENLLFGAFWICSLAAILLAFLARGH